MAKGFNQQNGDFSSCHGELCFPPKDWKMQNNPPVLSGGEDVPDNL